MWAIKITNVNKVNGYLGKQGKLTSKQDDAYLFWYKRDANIMALVCNSLDDNLFEVIPA